MKGGVSPPGSGGGSSRAYRWGGPVTVRVALADDHPMYRFGLRAVLDASPDVEVVGEAADGAEPLALIAPSAPHRVLTDLVDAPPVRRRRDRRAHPPAPRSGHPCPDNARGRCVAVRCT